MTQKKSFKNKVVKFDNFGPDPHHCSEKGDFGKLLNCKCF